MYKLQIISVIKHKLSDILILYLKEDLLYSYCLRDQLGYKETKATEASRVLKKVAAPGGLYLANDRKKGTDEHDDLKNLY
jgi:hypothetical protein